MTKPPSNSHKWCKIGKSSIMMGERWLLHCAHLALVMNKCFRTIPLLLGCRSSPKACPQPPHFRRQTPGSLSLSSLPSQPWRYSWKSNIRALKTRPWFSCLCKKPDASDITDSCDEMIIPQQRSGLIMLKATHSEMMWDSPWCTQISSFYETAFLFYLLLAWRNFPRPQRGSAVWRKCKERTENSDCNFL